MEPYRKFTCLRGSERLITLGQPPVMQDTLRDRLGPRHEWRGREA